MSRLVIRDRKKGIAVPFRLRPQQQRIMDKLKEHIATGHRLYVIFLKARRVGISSWASAIQLAHCCSKPDSRGAIVAQWIPTGLDLFDQASGFARDLLPINPGIVVKNKRISIPHQSGPDSYIRFHTAATVHGARGMTLSSLHMTEAAFYPLEDVYTSVLNTLSEDPDNVCMIETTANGMEGPGAPYYEAWQAAESGDSEFLPIFLPWWEDPDYIRDPSEAKDAPQGDYEKWLMTEVMNQETGKRADIGKGRIAWHRWALINKCEGSIDKWRAEFPAVPSEAFVATGQPAFSHEETQFAQRHQTPPLHYGELKKNPLSGKIDFHAASHPDESLLAIWEFPQPKAHYFFGIDTARGSADMRDNIDPGAKSRLGDFAAIVGWNAETGEMCLRYAARVNPESLAETAYLVGRYYNDACLNVEINNLGYVVMRDLRDRFFYPTQHRWKGRDDKFDGKLATALGFETNERYRRMMFNIFRTSLYRKEVIPKDKLFVGQMMAAKMEMGWRWEVEVGHDDIFMAGLLGWIAKEQYHPIKCHGIPSKNLLLTPEELAAAQIAMAGAAHSNAEIATLYKLDPTSTVFGALMQNANDHLRYLQRYQKAGGKVDRLAGL